MSIVKILQNFVKLAYLEVAFPKIGFFRILVCNLQTFQTSYVNNIFFDFVPTHILPTSGKNLIIQELIYMVW